MNKITFLIDGFNLYHSLNAVIDKTGKSAKWLNLHSLCSSYLYLFPPGEIKNIYYFSAFAFHKTKRDPEKVGRHVSYIKRLKSTGVRFIEGRFRPRPNIICHKCGFKFNMQEEKETDVAIAVTALGEYINDSPDIIVIITGDTDFAPLIKKCKELFPEKLTIFAFPYKRFNRKLKHLSPKSFFINKEQYFKHQFPNPVILRDGSKIYKPESW